MIVRSTQAAQVTTTASSHCTGRHTRHCRTHCLSVCGLLRSSRPRRHRPSIQVAAKEVGSVGRNKPAQPRFSKQLGRRKGDTAQEPAGDDTIVQPRFAKQLGLLEEDDTAQEVDSFGEYEPVQPRFAKQLGRHEEDTPADKVDTVSEDRPGKSRFSKQLGLLLPNEDNLDEFLREYVHQDEQPDAVPAQAPANSSQLLSNEDNLDEFLREYVQQEEQPDAEPAQVLVNPSPPEQEDLGLVPNKEGYQVIELEGCDFLLATTSDGSFDLSDAYVQDDESGIYAQPDVTSGELPATAQQYAQIQWQEEYLGDVVYDKPPKFLVKRVYLVHITQLEPRRLDLETVWVLDGERRTIYKAQVDRSTDSQDPTEMILRIRRDGSLLIDSAEEMPTPDELILEIEFGADADGSPLFNNSPQRWRMDDPDDALNDPIDAMGDDFDEPDVPAVDLA